MVVRVNVQHHKRGQGREGVETLADLLIEPVVDVEGNRDGIDVQGGFPDVEAPGLIRLDIDSQSAGPVEVDLESRSVHHNSERDDVGEDLRVWILFAQPNRLVESDAFGNVRPEAVTGMDGRGQDRTDVIEHDEGRIHARWYPSQKWAKPRGPGREGLRSPPVPSS